MYRDLGPASFPSRDARLPLRASVSALLLPRVDATKATGYSSAQKGVRNGGPMNIVGVTRLHDGKEVDEFVVGCEEHSYWYRGRPPLTTGCRECWAAFYTSQWALAGAKPEHIDQLEAAIHHATELASKGEFDFKPKLEDFKVEHED
jgi:hypothetical protein